MQGNGTTEGRSVSTLSRVVTRAYLDQQEEVGVLTLRGRSLGLLNVVSFEIDTLKKKRDETAPGRRLGQWTHHLGLAGVC